MRSTMVWVQGRTLIDALPAHRDVSAGQFLVETLQLNLIGQDISSIKSDGGYSFKY